VALWSADLRWVLEQEAGRAGRTRLGRYFHRRHDHPVHARRLAPSAGGFPAMVGNVAFLMKDVVLLAVSFYLLKQDAVTVRYAASRNEPAVETDQAARKDRHSAAPLI
jgi:hypothetical protein